MKLSTVIYYLGWASGLFGALLMLAGVIGFIIGDEFLRVRYFYNYFFIANSFLFLGIFCLVASHSLWCCKEEKKKE